MLVWWKGKAQKQSDAFTLEVFEGQAVICGAVGD